MTELVVNPQARTLGCRLAASISDIGESDWQRCAHTRYPFLRYEFLHALETASDAQDGAACDADSGWIPRHLVFVSTVNDEHAQGDASERVVGVMPLYLKEHSYGEYIFDWSWAEAYHRNGLNYYPKLLSAIPFTPSTGPRWALDQSALESTGHSRNEILKLLAEHIPQLCAQHKSSSFHLLYATLADASDLAAHNLLLRHSFQYHWFNQNSAGEHFASFEDFCGNLKARKRKAIRRERRDVESQDIVIQRLCGDAISEQLWDDFYIFYQMTYAKRSGHGGYLPKAFFRAIGERMGDQIMLVVAYKNEKLIAAALNFYSSDTLYGRYWGCTEEAEFLHFELCYYQGIEFCIERGLDKFDAGAQGEHKIQRGFRPIDTWSVHWIEHPEFRRAIAQFAEQERVHNRQHMDAAMHMLPFKTQDDAKT